MQEGVGVVRGGTAGGRMVPGGTAGGGPLASSKGAGLSQSGPTLKPVGARACRRGVGVVRGGTAGGGMVPGGDRRWRAPGQLPGGQA